MAERGSDRVQVAVHPLRGPSSCQQVHAADSGVAWDIRARLYAQQLAFCIPPKGEAAGWRESASRPLERSLRPLASPPL